MDKVDNIIKQQLRTIFTILSIFQLFFPHAKRKRDTSGARIMLKGTVLYL